MISHLKRNLVQLRNTYTPSPTENYINLIAESIANFSPSRDNDPIRILDYGCGVNSPVRKIKIHKLLLNKNIIWIGADIHSASLKESEEEKIHDRYILVNHPDKDTLPECDICLVLDMIEHLPKREGYNLINYFQSKAKVLIISTPNGFLKQEKTPENPHQEHLSGWTCNDFEKLNFKVFGIAGWLFIQEHYHDKQLNQFIWTENLRYPNWFFRCIRYLISWLPPSFYLNRPHLSRMLLAIKKCH